MAIPIVGLLVYTLAATGQLFNPVYEALYRYEVFAYPDLGYNGAWSLQDLRYIPQNLGIMLFDPARPDAAPATRASPGRPLERRRLLVARPAPGRDEPAPGKPGLPARPDGPGPLLRDRRVAGALLATPAIAVVNLMHFSQGWVQFGYRFSLDFAPFLLVAVALGTERFLGPPGRVAAAPAGRRGRPRRRVGGDPGVGHRLGPDARLVSAAAAVGHRPRTWARRPRGGAGPSPSLRRRCRAAPGRGRRLRPGAQRPAARARASGTPASSRPWPPLLGTAHPTGFPTYVILGWLASLVLAPLGEPALRMNLLSAILLGVAAGLTVVLVRQLTGADGVAVAAGLLLALTPLAWRMGAFADPHTLHLALLAGLLVLLVGWEQRRRARARRARTAGSSRRPSCTGSCSATTP